jgi:catalase (peroxidase I)
MMLAFISIILGLLSQQALGFQPAVAKVSYRESTQGLSTSVKTHDDNHDVTALYNTRRDMLESFFATSVIAYASVFAPSTAFASDGVDYKAVADDIAALVVKTPDWGPTLVRLAWHSSGTYDKMLNNGGSSGGTIRFKEELAHGGNAGLGETAVSWMEPIYNKYKDQGLSYADLYTLGGGKYSNN